MILERLTVSQPSRVWVLAAATGVAACGGVPPDTLDVGQFGVVGGLVAPNPELDHTSAIVKVDEKTGARSVLCSAVLIAAETALTAKHCADRVALVRLLGDHAALAIGFDIDTAELVPVVALELPPPAREGGALGSGYDLAVIHIDEPVGLRPAKLHSVGLPGIRGSAVTLGYGMPTAWSAPDGLRRIGRETVVAVSGLVYEILYGDFESFVEVELTGASTNEDYLARIAADPALANLEALRYAYANTHLIPDHEVVTKTLDANTRSCRGDSGGPLLRVSAQGEWEVLGVLSGGPSSLRAECDFGQVWSTLGPVTLPFVEASRDWTDPCGAVGTAGACNGTVAERCESGWGENVRQLLREDCGASGLRCQEAGGVARCVAAKDG